MSEPLIIARGQFRLTVVNTDGRFSLRTSGGGNVTEDEFARIADYVAGNADADRFLAKIRTRMER
jgi:hypothetical protein